MKYQHPERGEPRVGITVQREGRTCTIAVCDNGVGVPADQREHLFVMFKRFHPELATGSGLGLYMARRNARALGGSVRYTPLEPGSCFTVQLPDREAVN